jgi:hypothetical protein
MKVFQIVVRKDGKKWRLWNALSNCTCGPKHDKGDGEGKNAQFPFPNLDEWWLWDKKKGAEQAAEKLQKYLDVRDGQLSKERAK